MSYGHKPFSVTLSAKEYRESYFGKINSVFEHNWQRISSDCNYKKVDEGLELTFEVWIPDKIIRSDFICVSYVLPFSLDDINKSIDKFQTKILSHRQNLYFNRRIICKSFENRNCELITLTLSE